MLLSLIVSILDYSILYSCQELINSLQILNNTNRFYEDSEEQKIIEVINRIQTLFSQPYQMQQKLSQLNPIYCDSYVLVLLLRKCLRICAENYNVYENSEIIPAMYSNRDDYFDFLLSRTSTLGEYDYTALLDHLSVEVIYVDSDNLRFSRISNFARISNTGKYTIHI